MITAELIQEAMDSLEGAIIKEASSSNTRAIILKDEYVAAPPLISVVDSIIKEDWTEWEAEAIWNTIIGGTTFIVNINKSKLLAARLVRSRPVHVKNALVFEKVVNAFNSVLPDPDKMQECSVLEICWAVKQIEILRNEPLILGPDPISYIAVVLKRNGFVSCPKIIEICQDRLNELTEKKDLSDQILSVWKGISKTNLIDREYKENVTDIQLAKLVSVDLYLLERMKEYTQTLALLNEPII